MAFNTWSAIARTFQVNDGAGVARNRVVVQGTNAYEVKNPAASNASKIRGITEFASGNSGYVTVRRGGSYRATAASAIAVGDYVNIADTAGRVKTINEAASTVVYIVGEAMTAASASGDEVDVDLKLMGTRYTA